MKATSIPSSAAFVSSDIRDRLQKALHFALVRGRVDDGPPVLTRVHVRNTLSDVLHLERSDLGLTVTAALRRIADEGRGVVVVLAGDETPEALIERLTSGRSEEQTSPQWRQLGLGAQILADLGVQAPARARHAAAAGGPARIRARSRRTRRAAGITRALR